MPVTRPLINYFGGKWRIAPWIIDNMPEHDIYVEPFSGGASVLFRKPRSKREIINDIDAELVNLYYQVRDNGPELKRRLGLTPHARVEYHLAMQDCTDPIESARRTVVRCYFGIGDSFLHKHNAFRTSKTSNTSVAHSWTNFVEALDGIIERLKNVTIECLHYEQMFKKYDSPETLWYLDPPYMPSTRTRSHSYREEFTGHDHVVFLKLVKKLTGRVLLSAYDNDIYTAELTNWLKLERDAAVQGGKKRREILWVSP